MHAPNRRLAFLRRDSNCEGGGITSDKAVRHARNHGFSRFLRRLTRNMKSEGKKTSTFEITLRAIGQALEALGVESFELFLEGDTFVVYGGTNSSPVKEKKASKRFQLFGRNKSKLKSRRGFYFSGMRFQERDIEHLDRQGKDIRISAERCPDTNSISNGLRMIGAHIDNAGMSLLGVVGHDGHFTVWHRNRSGGELKQIFTKANLYDLWVHLYKQRTGMPLKQTGTGAT